MQIGFIGLGAMGAAMVKNLKQAGYSVRAWDRTPGRAPEGVASAATASEALQSEVVFTMLPDDGTIRQVILDAGALEQANPKLVHVVMSTISVAFARELSDVHDRNGLGYVSAPVLGRPDVAAKGELNILAGGKHDAVESVRPMLQVLGKKIWPMGEDPAQANAAKIAANMMITMAIEALAEAVVIVEASGLPRQTFFDLILNTLFSGRAYESYSANVAEERYEPGFKARLGLKDLGLAVAAAPRPLPVLQAVQGRMREAVEAGMGERDWSAMADFTLKH